MDLRRLHLLLELSRLGSMRAVAETHRLTTSTVSQQIAALSREVRTPLVEPEGRRVRLTPAGHGSPTTPSPSWRPSMRHSWTSIRTRSRRDVCGSAASRPPSALPCCRSSVRWSASHPQVEVLIHEYEPEEALALLTDDDLDLALTYDYNLVPASLGPRFTARPLWSTRVGPGGVGIGGTGERHRGPRLVGGPTVDRELAQHRGRGGREHPGVPGRLHAEDRPPDRQPRAGRGPDRRRPRDRVAATRQAHVGRRTRAAPGRTDGGDEGVRRHATGSRELATAPAALGGGGAGAPQPRIFSR